MTTLTFTGNNYSEITSQVMQFIEQMGAKLVPPQPVPNFTPDAHAHTIEPHMQPAPVVPAPVVPAPAQQMAPPAPVVPAPAQQMAPPAPVPTAPAPDYTHEQLGRAVAAWIDRAPDNRNKALALLQGLGVLGVTQLNTPALRGAFAVALREQGVQV